MGYDPQVGELAEGYYGNNHPLAVHSLVPKDIFLFTVNHTHVAGCALPCHAGWSVCDGQRVLLGAWGYCPRVSPCAFFAPRFCLFPMPLYQIVHIMKTISNPPPQGYDLGMEVWGGEVSLNQLTLHSCAARAHVRMRQCLFRRPHYQKNI